MARKSRKRNPSEYYIPAARPSVSSWIYARISRDGERAEDSIDNQIAICKEYIHSGTELTLGGVFTDLGYSGTDFERPGYSDMLAGILRGDIACVVVKDLSRPGRTYIEVGELLFDTFAQYGVRFVSVNDAYDSFADDACRKKLLVLFKSLVNHMYSRDLGKKIKSAHAAKKMRGEPAGLPPYGYRHGGKRLEIEPEEAAVVRMIFNMRLQGESEIGIAKVLNQSGVLTPQNRRYQLGEISHENFSKRIVWTASLISRILHNETYTGALIQGKYDCRGKKSILLPKDQWIVHENAHDAIIDKALFSAAARLLEETAAKYRHVNRHSHEENRYIGKITCTRCGKTAVRTDNHSKEPIRYYYSCPHCLNDLKFEQGLKRGPKLPLTRLDALIMETLRKHMDALVRFDNLVEILEKSDPLKRKRAALKSERARLEKDAGNAGRSLTAAYTHHLEGLLDLREYELVRAKIERDKADSDARLASVKAEQAKYDARRIIENQWLVKYRAFRDCETPTKELIETLIERVYLTPLTNEVQIIVSYEDSFEDLRLLLRESEGGAG